MTFFDSEIKQAKEKQIEAEQIVSDWHHAQVLCIEILELIEGALPLFSYRDWETDRKSTRLNSSHRL